MHRRATLLIPVVVLALAVPQVAAASEPTGSCVSAEVPAAVVLPDGSLHPPGRLVLCFASRLSPVSEIHKITAGGTPGGLFVGRTGRPEMRAERPYVVFHRNANDEWILIGLVRPPRGPDGQTTRVRLTDPKRLESLVAQGLRERPPAPLEETILATRGDGEDRRTVMLAAR